MISGVYFIINTVNKKFYVGSTFSISKRFKEHKNDLNGNRHENSELQRSWNKYGESAFTFSFIRCPLNQILIEEQFWLDAYFPLGVLYNRNPIAGTTLGRRHTEEAKQKLSTTRKTDEKLIKVSIKNLKDYRKSFEGRKHIKKLNRAKLYQWFVLEPGATDEILVTNLPRYCQDKGLEVTCMRKLASGVHKSNHKGYKCRRA